MDKTCIRWWRKKRKTEAKLHLCGSRERGMRNQYVANLPPFGKLMHGSLAMHLSEVQKQAASSCRESRPSVDISFI